MLHLYAFPLRSMQLNNDENQASTKMKRVDPNPKLTVCSIIVENKAKGTIHILKCKVLLWSAKSIMRD